MDEGTMLIQNEDGEWEKYDGTYDVVIHCDSKEDQQKVVGMLKKRDYGLYVNAWMPLPEPYKEKTE